MRAQAQGFFVHSDCREPSPIVKLPERDGAALIRELDAAGIKRAVVLSVGYSFADERKDLADLCARITSVLSRF